MTAVPAIPVVLEYAQTQTFDDADTRSAFRSLLWLSILSGLCVGVCFLSFTENVAAHALHVVIFGLTIIVGARGGPALMRLGASFEPSCGRKQLALDLIATVGILIIGIAPVVYWSSQQYQWHDAGLAAAGLGVAYTLLACTTARHVMLYRLLAVMCRNIGRTGMARALLVLGWFKAIYEGIWLACCAIPLLLVGMSGGRSDPGDVAFPLLFAALFGAMGFAGVWVWMIIVHAKLLRLAR